MMATTKIAAHTHPNAVCAICQKNGKLTTAVAEVDGAVRFARHFVCAFHLARHEAWKRIEATSAEYRRRKAGSNE